MWKRLRFWLPGMALVAGGVVSGTCHLFNFESPTDLAHVAQYPPLGAPVHLTLFAGGLLVLAGWIARFAVRQSGADSIALAALICLFIGVLCGDLLHSILEFSVFPAVDQCRYRFFWPPAGFYCWPERQRSLWPRIVNRVFLAGRQFPLRSPRHFRLWQCFRAAGKGCRISPTSPSAPALAWA